MVVCDKTSPHILQKKVMQYPRGCKIRLYVLGKDTTEEPIIRRSPYMTCTPMSYNCCHRLLVGSWRDRKRGNNTMRNDTGKPILWRIKVQNSLQPWSILSVVSIGLHCRLLGIVPPSQVHSRTFRRKINRRISFCINPILGKQP